MNFYDYLTLFGGISLFLFGMKYMSAEIESREAVNLKKTILSFTDSKFKGFLAGAASTALIQSSSAVTATVTGLVGSSVIPLENAVGLIIGSNVGTTVTSWVIGIAGAGENLPLLTLLNPLSLASVSAIIGIVLHSTAADNEQRKSASSVMFGFSVLMCGLHFMSDSAQGLKNQTWALNLFSELSKPAAGFAAGLMITAIVQSSSVSVGILQTVSVTGAFSVFSCIPVILGQNIGACAAALLASVSGNRLSKAAALVHLYFNLFSSAVFYLLSVLALKITDFDFFYSQADSVNIALIHTAFNSFAAILMLPLSSLLQKAAIKTVKGVDLKRFLL